MTGRNRRWIVAVAACVAVAGTVAGTAVATLGTGDAARGALVKIRKTTLGRVLVDARGRTLYLFEADKGKRSVCYGACATAWPPLLTKARPHAGAGVKAALLGTTKRKDGKLQVTYRNHPLYFFLEDTKAGQTSGQGLDGFGGEWYVLAPTGQKIEHATGSNASSSSSGSTTTTTTSDSGGYSYG